MKTQGCFVCGSSYPRRTFLKLLSLKVAGICLSPLMVTGRERSAATNNVARCSSVVFEDRVIFPFIMGKYLTADISPKERRVVFLSTSHTNFAVKLSSLIATKTTTGIKIIVGASTLRRIGATYERTDEYLPLYEISLLNNAGNTIASAFHRARKMEFGFQTGGGVYRDVPPIEVLFEDVKTEIINSIAIRAE